jgi:hypothetical protein
MPGATQGLGVTVYQVLARVTEMQDRKLQEAEKRKRLAALFRETDAHVSLKKNRRVEKNACSPVHSIQQQPRSGGFSFHFSFSPE